MFLQEQPSYHHNLPYTTLTQCITFMIVTVLYYHSSIITIMVKNNNILYINLRQKQRTIRNRCRICKTASFFTKTSISFDKNNLDSYSRPGCKRYGHPDVGEVQTRIFVDSCRRCREVYLPCQGHFYALFLLLIRRKRTFLTNSLIFDAVVLIFKGKSRQE